MGLTKKIDHLTVVVKDVETAAGTFTRHFGFPVEPAGAVDPEGPRTRLRIGDATLDVLGPTDSASPAGRYLADRGEGMYQLVLEVEDLAAATAQLGARGITLRRHGLPSGAQMGVLDPKDTHGVALALIEHPRRGV